MATADEKRLVIQAMAKLAHRKGDCYREFLAKAGIPWEVVEPYFRVRRPLINPDTQQRYTKREVANFVLAWADSQPNPEEVYQKLIQAIASFSRFELAEVEFDARAVVEQAKAILPATTVRMAHAKQERDRLAAQLEADHRAKEEEKRRAQAEAVQKRHFLLLAEYDGMQQWDDHQRRGERLEYLAQNVFELAEIRTRRPFCRNARMEQIDGGIHFDSKHILVQIKWQKEPLSDSEIEYARSQRQRSGADLLLLLSVNGWTSSVIPLLKQNPDKDTILMNGYELRLVLAGTVTMRDMLRRKIDALRFDAEPFLLVTGDT